MFSTTIGSKSRNISIFISSLLFAVLTIGARGEELYLPQVAVGGPPVGLSINTVVYLTNPTELATSGTLDVYDNDGNPLPVLMDGTGPTASIVWSLEPGEVVRLVISSASEELQVGSMRIDRQSLSTRVVAMFNVFASGAIDSWVGVPVSTDTTTGFGLVFDTTDLRNTGLAICNPNDEKAEVSIHLVSGNSVLRTVERTLPADGHISEILSPLFSDVPGVSEMLALVRVESDLPVVAMTLMLEGTKYTFLPLLTLEGGPGLPPL